ncbi:elongation factor P--(R)-beta-lysine ligase [Spirochaetia bacterium]|nr:elongation factor P--(R)-beta-lysine ligase [Spirochaetia bacterium]
MDIEMLQERARIIRQVRSFFDRKNYLELDTPLLSPDLIPESCLEVFETTRLAPPGSSFISKPYWLIPSPEIWMKRIIAQHRVNVYQVCKCFRNGESSGHLHSPEFTMLEYYTMDADYLDSLSLTEELFANLAETPKLKPPFERITVAEAFARWAGFDLYKAAEAKGGMEAEARRLGLAPPADLGVPALYDLIFIHAVEPRLKADKPIALLDYPAFVPCLARQNAGGKTVERWELYFNGIELANCYSEETDPQKVKYFFESEAAAREQTALVHHKVDHDYWKMFLPRAENAHTKDAGHAPAATGFPRCSGVALGLDRLIMALTARSTIDSVLPFPTNN